MAVTTVPVGSFVTPGDCLGPANNLSSGSGTFISQGGRNIVASLTGSVAITDQAGGKCEIRVQAGPDCEVISLPSIGDEVTVKYSNRRTNRQTNLFYVPIDG
eukprot:637257_1